MQKKEDEKKEFSKKLLRKLSSGKKTPNQILASARLPVFHFAHRLCHLIFILPILPVAFCLHIALILRKIFTRKPVFIVEQFYGKKGCLVSIRYFNIHSGSNLALFYHVLTGKLSLTGYSLNKEREVGDAFIYDYAPGIINLWYIRSASRTAYEGIKETDKEFVHTELLKAELNPGLGSFLKLTKAEFLLLIRFLVAKFFHLFQSVKFMPAMFDPIFLFNIRIRNISMQHTLDEINKTIIDARSQPGQMLRRKIYFVNPDCFNKTFSSHAADYRHILENIKTSDWIFADGIGINIAIDMLGYPKNENINGTDLLPRLSELAEQNGFSFFLLGAAPRVADKMKDKLEEKYPLLNIKGTHPGYFDWDKDSPELVKKINDLKVDILFVALGVPNQERWIEKWFPELNCTLALGVGGLFDFYSGRIKRAPRWLRDIGLEWVFRLLMEPRRMFSRYIIGNPLFLRRVQALRKAAFILIRKMRHARKNNSLEIIELAKADFMIKRHASLVDIFPLIINFCTIRQIPVYLCWKDSKLAEQCSLKLARLYPAVQFSSNLADLSNSYLLIIADHDPQEIVITLKNKSLVATCLIDLHFTSEFSQINILT